MIVLLFKPVITVFMSTQDICDREQAIEEATNSKVEYKAIALSGRTSLTVVLPRQFSVGLGLGKGDYVRITQDGKRLIIEKAD
jgi:hypothetical protein